MPTLKSRHYRIKSFVLKSGERYCLLLDKAAGLPLYYPNLFVTTQVRNNSKSVAAMESALSGINVLLSFCDEMGIDLTSRFLKREFLVLHELDAFRDYCQQSFSKAGTESPEVVVPIARGGRSKSSPKVGLASEYMRLTHAAKYTEWLAKVLLSTANDRSSAIEIAKMKKGLEARRPARKGRNQTARESGLNKEQVAILLELVRPGSEFNPFDDSGIQVRNRLIILLLLYLGIRGGELLNIRVSDIYWSNNQIVIARRADEKTDPRVNQPLVKTLDRRIPVKDTLVEAIREYITKYRNKIPNARRHDYLLITHKSGPTQGQPMSRPAYNKTIKLIASAVPELFDMHGHDLRHTWNNEFSELMDRMDDPPSPEEQEKRRSYLQGWKEGSGTAATYTRRFVRKKATEASLKLQEGITRIPENLKNG